MSINQDQVEELEVLQAIYEEDERFKEINETTVQYRFGELGDNKSFLLEVSWPKDYPECIPEIKLDAFYNKHIAGELKTLIVDKIKEEIADSVGTAMTFTIFQWAGENMEELMAQQPHTMEVCVLNAHFSPLLSPTHHSPPLPPPPPPPPPPSPYFPTTPLSHIAPLFHHLSPAPLLSPTSPLMLNKIMSPQLNHHQNQNIFCCKFLGKTM